MLRGSGASDLTGSAIRQKRTRSVTLLHAQNLDEADVAKGIDLAKMVAPSDLKFEIGHMSCLYLRSRQKNRLETVALCQ